jgi:putative ABC transport system permease protein
MITTLEAHIMILISFLKSFLFIGSLQLGLLYAVMALGIYITFRILDLPDLTVDGSFVLGMAITAVITVKGHPFLALFIAMLIGAIAGITTGLLQTKMGIHPILSGILVMTALYSINLFIMGGKSNISLVGSETIFMKFDKITNLSDDTVKIIVGIIICVLLTIILFLLFKTRLGLAIRATGDNEDMVRSSSINADFTKCIGLAMGNGLVALSGGLICQYSMFSDVTAGSGMVVIGLASVIIGEAFFGKRSVTIGFISTIIGSILYWLIRALALNVELFPAYALKLITSIIVAIALLLPTIKENYKIAQMKRRGR